MFAYYAMLSKCLPSRSSKIKENKGSVCVFLRIIRLYVVHVLKVNETINNFIHINLIFPLKFEIIEHLAIF